MICVLNFSTSIWKLFEAVQSMDSFLFTSKEARGVTTPVPHVCTQVELTPELSEPGDAPCDCGRPASLGKLLSFRRDASLTARIGRGSCG